MSSCMDAQVFRKHLKLPLTCLDLYANSTRAYKRRAVESLELIHRGLLE